MKARNKKAGITVPVTVVSLGDKLKLVGLAGGSFALVLWAFVISCENEEKSEIDKQLKVWQASYHLSESDVSQMREMELAFHGNGNPFIITPNTTAQQSHQHHLAISRIINEPDRARFLNEVENSQEH